MNIPAKRLIFPVYRKLMTTSRILEGIGILMEDDAEDDEDSIQLKFNMF